MSQNTILSKMLDRLFAGLANGPNLNCRPHSSRQRVDWSQFANLQDRQPADALRQRNGIVRYQIYDHEVSDAQAAARDMLGDAEIKYAINGLLSLTPDAIPVLEMIRQTKEQLKAKAEELARRIEGAEVIEGESVIGGGSTPDDVGGDHGSPGTGEVSPSVPRVASGRLPPSIARKLRILPRPPRRLTHGPQLHAIDETVLREDVRGHDQLRGRCQQPSGTLQIVV